MSFTASRTMLRQSQFALRRAGVRNASSTSGSTGASLPGPTTTSKASEGLSKVSSSAGSGLSKAGSAVTNTVSSIGGRTGRMINFVQSLIPPTVYYSRVGLELAKLVFQGQKMSPPSMQAFQTYMQPMINAVRHPASMFTQTVQSSTAQPSSIMSRMRNVDNQSMVAAGIVLAEAIGFFTVGEMIGRRKIIGYHTAAPAPDAQVHH
ncbi:ATP synthase subunit G atp20 [Cryomyces antarcticus]|uniref:ATP synthase subunit G atp20 n=1 Tax=Cryomyces antarcticus TaxID=329879 RepID=A0ABR0LNZ3_9PEZI|nr:ATP synthase subunit G atp20 [Cryomyces antarcticus]KAK5201280.1 ATP synthase subunit G atp20 [Cryomyces antarcticus]